MPSLINIVAICLYLIVVMACIAAAWAARSSRRPARRQLHWLGCAAAFLGLAAMRALAVENSLRAALREALVSADAYAIRGEIQLPIALAILLACATAALLTWRHMRNGRHSPGERLVWMARLATLAFIPLLALRIVSFHFTDILLYRGPVRLNWLLDGSLTLAAGACAMLYVAYCRKNRPSAAEDRSIGA